MFEEKGGAEAGKAFHNCHLTLEDEKYGPFRGNSKLEAKQKAAAFVCDKMGLAHSGIPTKLKSKLHSKQV